MGQANMLMMDLERWKEIMIIILYANSVVIFIIVQNQIREGNIPGVKNAATV